MRVLPDGTVVSSNFQTRDTPNASEVYNTGLRLMIGQIDKVHFTDDSTNISKEFVEYDVSVRDAQGGQSTYTNCRKLESLFGGRDFEETILEPSEISYTTGLILPSTPFKSKNGTIVVVAFINGLLDKPFIVGTLSHPRKVGSTKDKGVNKRGEFRGFQWQITKDGELLLTYNGSRNLLGLLERPATGPLRIKIDKDGKFNILDQENQSITLDRTSKTIELKQLLNPNLPNIPDPLTGDLKETAPISGPTVNYFKMDKNAQAIEMGSGIAPVVQKIDGQGLKYTLTFPSGMKLEMDGTGDKATISTAAGSKVEISATGGILAKDAIGGTLKINTGKVGLGGPAGELVTEFEKLLTQMDSLLTALQAETHLGNLGYPTGTPINIASYTAVQAQIAAIKAIITLIKGGI